MALPVRDSVSSSDTGASNAASLTWSHTVASGDNRALFVVVALRNSGSETITSVTYGGVTMESFGSVTRSTDVHAEIFFLLAPAVGTANVVATPSGTAKYCGAAVSYTNVYQDGDPLANLATRSQGAAGVTVDITTAETLGLCMMARRSSNDWPVASHYNTTAQEHLAAEVTSHATAGQNVGLELDEFTPEDDEADEDSSQVETRVGWTSANSYDTVLLAVAIIGSEGAATVDSVTHSRLPFGMSCLIKRRTDIPLGILGDAAIKGVGLRDQWVTLEPTEGNFDWTYLDGVIDDAQAADKWIMLRTSMSWELAPTWAQAGVTTVATDPVSPLPWDTTWMARKKAVLTAAAARYNNEANIRVVAIAHANASTDDWNIPHSDAEVLLWQAAGWTPEIFIEAIKEYIDHAMSVWTKPVVTMAVAQCNNADQVWPLALEPSQSYCARVIAEWAFAKYCGRFMINKNALSGFSPFASEAGTASNRGWEIVRDFSPHVATQNLSFVKSNSYRMNQENAEDFVSIFSKVMSRGMSFRPRFMEMHPRDLLYSDFRPLWVGKLDDPTDVDCGAPSKSERERVLVFSDVNDVDAILSSRALTRASRDYPRADAVVYLGNVDYALTTPSSARESALVAAHKMRFTGRSAGLRGVDSKEDAASVQREWPVRGTGDHFVRGPGGAFFWRRSGVVSLLCVDARTFRSATSLFGTIQEAWIRDQVHAAEKSTWLACLVPCVYNQNVMTSDGIGSVAASYTFLQRLLASHLNPVVFSGRLHSGGGHNLDTADLIHEFSVPHLDLSEADETLGAPYWNHGIITGVDNPGFTHAEFSNTEAVVTFHTASGGVRYRHSITARTRGR